MNRIVHAVTKGADKVVLENLSPKAMTSYGRNHKRTMNRSMRENRVGEFRRKVVQKCEALGIELVAVPAKYTSQTCHVCGHVDNKSQSTRDTFKCVLCNREFHADINAAYSNRLPCTGRLSESSMGWFTRPTARCHEKRLMAGAIIQFLCDALNDLLQTRIRGTSIMVAHQ